MSIIYEALKKTQDKREVNVEAITSKRKFKFPSWKVWRYIGIGTISLALISSGIYLLSPWVLAKKESANKPYMVKLTLNGVFISTQEKMAMINNRMLHVGDNIAGLNIVSIDYDGVALSNGQAKLVLHQ